MTGCGNGAKGRLSALILEEFVCGRQTGRRTLAFFTSSLGLAYACKCFAPLHPFWCLISCARSGSGCVCVLGIVVVVMIAVAWVLAVTDGASEAEVESKQQG